MEAGVKIMCKKCKDVIQSLSRHDFKTCECGAISIDGGNDYTKITGDLHNIDYPGEWEDKPINFDLEEYDKL